MRFNSFPLECGLDLMTRFQRMEHGKATVTLWQRNLADTLTKWSKLTSLAINHIDIMLSSDMMQWEGCFTSVEVFKKKKKIHNPSLIKSQCRPIWNWEVFYKVPDHSSLKLSRWRQTRKYWETVKDWRKFGRHDDRTRAIWKKWRQDRKLDWVVRRGSVGRWYPYWNMNDRWSQPRE